MSDSNSKKDNNYYKKWLHKERFPKSAKYDLEWLLANEMGPNALWLLEELTKHMELPKESRVLDMGCGYGAVGIVLAKCCPKCTVVMTDVNKRAVKLARMNAKLNKVDVDIKQGNLYEGLDGEKFDTIITNPPQKAGKEICLEIIEKSKEFLKKGGLLQVVARHQKGGKHLSKKMEEAYNQWIREVKANFKIEINSTQWEKITGTKDISEKDLNIGTP